MKLWIIFSSLAILCFTSCKENPDTSAQISWNEAATAAEARLDEKTETSTTVSASTSAPTYDTSASTLIAEDSFEINHSNYVVKTSLKGQRPITLGFNGPWRTSKIRPRKENSDTSISLVGKSSLTYPGLKTSGGKMVIQKYNLSGRIGRHLSTSYTDASKGTIYISFLMKNNEFGVANSYRALELYDSKLGDAPNGLNDENNRRFALGSSENDFGTAGFGFRINNDLAFSRELASSRNTEVNLFVLKFDLSDEPLSDSVTVWMNPEVGAPLYDGVSVSGFDVSFDTISLARFGNSLAVNLDEIRIGDTYSAVTPRL